MSAYPHYWPTHEDRLQIMERSEQDARLAIEFLFEQGEWDRLVRLQRQLGEILMREAAE